jgi:DNA-binding NarL/FixJ family response regulator
MNIQRVLIADDHPIPRSGLRCLIQRDAFYQVVAEASNGREAVELAARHAPDLAVIDVAMPMLNGIDAAHQIIGRNSRTAVAVLSMHADECYVLRALLVGVRAYVLKESAESELLSALHALVSGQTYFSPKVADMLRQDWAERLRDNERADSFELLTPREREIVQLAGEGKANKEIAAILQLSVYTVETHRGNILEKLGLHTTADLILFAVRKGLVR